MYSLMRPRRYYTHPSSFTFHPRDPPNTQADFTLAHSRAFSCSSALSINPTFGESSGCYDLRRGSYLAPTIYYKLAAYVRGLRKIKLYNNSLNR